MKLVSSVAITETAYSRAADIVDGGLSNCTSIIFSPMLSVACCVLVPLLRSVSMENYNLFDTFQTKLIQLYSFRKDLKLNISLEILC